jgi:hypothetical protein
VEAWECDDQGVYEMNPQNNPFSPFATREEYKYIQCGLHYKCMKTYYDNVLNEDNTPLRSPSFKNRNGVQKLVASMKDDLALGKCELHTLEVMIWNDNHQCPIKYCSRNIITCL